MNIELISNIHFRDQGEELKQILDKALETEKPIKLKIKGESVFELKPLSFHQIFGSKDGTQSCSYKCDLTYMQNKELK